jgi:hypothetical protein
MNNSGEARFGLSSECLFGSHVMSRHTSWLMTAILCCGAAVLSAGQSKSANPASQDLSLGETLRNPAGKEIHIFYVHGIGSYGPNDRDSLAMRKNLCDYLKDCTTPAGTVIGEWDYADKNEFRLDAPVPTLEYLDQRIWKSEEEWHASAPYAVHFQLVRSSGQSLYVDEINWWPLTFSLKCRQLVASDASFVAPSKEKIDTCSTREPNQRVPQRFKSYDWISRDEATRLRQLPRQGASLNRDLKTGLMDWGFPDAVMALGPLRSYILEGIRQLILKSVSDVPRSSGADPEKPRSNQEFMIVTHSLGSYLTFSALDDIDSTEKTAATEQTKSDLDEILKRTSLVVFFANQLRLLELASLDGPSERNFATHLQDWGKTRCEYLESLPDAPQECKHPRIIALNDPSDLLTWTVPALGIFMSKITP